MADDHSAEFKEFGKYQIISEIGQGAMGVVYKAHDPVLDRHVAIKTISASLGTDDELRKRFHREAQAAARLNHQNIITVYDYGEEHGKIYIAMELLEGTDLKDLMARRALTGLEDQLAVMEQILDGLAFAHAKEVVHRDLKPGNIHVQPNGQIKILDFGLARLGSSDMTQTGMVMGTPNYMSPEQVLGDKIDSRSDVFSIGAVFYEVLSGHKPFESESMHGVLFQVVHKEPQPIREWNGQLPPILVQVVEKCLAKDKDQRFQNGGELRDAVAVVRHAIAAGRLHEVTLDAESGRVFYEGEVLEDGVGRPRSWPPTPALKLGSLPPGSFSPASVPPSSVPPSMPGSMPPSATPDASPPGASASQPGRERWVDGTAVLDPRADASDSRPPVARRSPGTLPGRMRTGAAIPPPRRPSPPRSRLPIYAGLGIAGVGLLAVGILVWMAGGESTPSPSPTVGDPGIVDDLVAAKVDLARSHLDAKRFRQAIATADEALELDGAHAAARSIKQQAQAKLGEVAAAAQRARALYTDGDVDGAADALHQLLELDPNHPEAAELSSVLGQQFQSRARDAQREMERSRAQALAASARSTSEYQEGEQLEVLAGASFRATEFAEAARKYLEARDAYDRAGARARVAQATPTPTAPPTRETPTPAVATATPTPVAQATPTPRPTVAQPTRLPLRAQTTQNESGSGRTTGFEGAANPDFIGEIEFDAPATIGAGDDYRIRIFLKNVGQKRMKLREMALTTIVDGDRLPVSVPLLTDTIEVGERAQVAELGGNWDADVKQWVLSIRLVGDKGDTTSNSLVFGSTGRR